MSLIQEAPLSVDAVIAAVKRSSAGAVSTFIGMVRDHNEGRPVTRLDYEAYAEMCEQEFAKIRQEIASTFQGVQLAAAHRVGALEVGDIAVVCAASAPHRGEAFAACRRLIDEIKHRLPIWKREYGPDGAYWVGWVDARCSASPVGSAAKHR